MINSITTKFEINIPENERDPRFAADFARQHRCPAVVAHPTNLAHLAQYKFSSNANYSIISTIDSPSGSNFALDKFWYAGNDISAANGYDIVLSTNKTQVESFNEMKAISTFLRSINPMVDLRWVLPMFSMDAELATKILENMKHFPSRFVRIDPHTSLPHITLDDYERVVSHLRKTSGLALKLSGNITLDVVKRFRNENVRFDVTVDQAAKLVHEVENELSLAK